MKCAYSDMNGKQCSKKGNQKIYCTENPIPTEEEIITLELNKDFAYLCEEHFKKFITQKVN